MIIIAVGKEAVAGEIRENLRKIGISDKKIIWEKPKSKLDF